MLVMFWALYMSHITVHPNSKSTWSNVTGTWRLTDSYSRRSESKPI